jgi:hypothetical protein
MRVNPGLEVVNAFGVHVPSAQTGLGLLKYVIAKLSLSAVSLR